MPSVICDGILDRSILSVASYVRVMVNMGSRDDYSKEVLRIIGLDSSEKMDGIFDSIFSVLSKEMFMDDPLVISSYLRDVNIPAPIMRI